MYQQHPDHGVYQEHTITVCMRSTQTSLLYEASILCFLRCFFSDLVHENELEHFGCIFVVLLFIFYPPLEGFALCFPGNHVWNKGKDLFCGEGVHF